MARLYTAGLGRIPERGGFDFWMTEYTTGRWGLPRMATFFTQSAEFKASYGALNQDGFIRQLYRNVLGREGEVGGVAFWTLQLNNGAMDRGTVLLRFAESPENITRSGTSQPTLGPFNSGLFGRWTCAGWTPATPGDTEGVASPTTTTTAPTTTVPTTPTTAPPSGPAQCRVERAEASLQSFFREINGVVVNASWKVEPGCEVRTSELRVFREGIRREQAGTAVNGPSIEDFSAAVGTCGIGRYGYLSSISEEGFEFLAVDEKGHQIGRHTFSLRPTVEDCYDMGVVAVCGLGVAHIARRPGTNDADVSLQWTGPFCVEVLTSTVTVAGQTFVGSGDTVTFVLPNACHEGAPVAYSLGGTATLDTGRTSSVPYGPGQGITAVSLPESECSQP